MSRTFSTTYYVIVVVGGGLAVALYGTLTEPGDTYGGLVLGLIIILVGCLLPLFAAPETEAGTVGAGPAKAESTETTEHISNDAVGARDPLAEGWDLPL